MRKETLFIPFVFICLFWFSACYRYEFYVFPQRDFDISIPLTVKNYYDVDTVPAGFGINPERALVLQVTAEEFEQYAGHFHFQKIDTVGTSTKMRFMGSDGLEIFHPEYDPSVKKAQTVSARFGPRNLHYNFDFHNGYVYLDEGGINRLVFYDPAEGILIFYTMSFNYKYPNKKVR